MATDKRSAAGRKSAVRLRRERQQFIVGTVVAQLPGARLLVGSLTEDRAYDLEVAPRARVTRAPGTHQTTLGSFAVGDEVAAAGVMTDGRRFVANELCSAFRSGDGVVDSVSPGTLIIGGRELKVGPYTTYFNKDDAEIASHVRVGERQSYMWWKDPRRGDTYAVMIHAVT